MRRRNFLVRQRHGECALLIEAGKGIDGRVRLLAVLDLDGWARPICGDLFCLRDLFRSTISVPDFSIMCLTVAGE